MPPVLTAGNIEILRIVEYPAMGFDTRMFFPGLTDEMLAENRPWLEPVYLDPATGRTLLCIQSYVVRTRHHTILVDTCIGNHKNRPNRPMFHMLDSDAYERNFAAAGLDVADIDFVMCTHLHADHTGWNTKLENGSWVPTFPNARYIFAEREMAYWQAAHEKDPDACAWMTDSVLPVVAAGRAEIVTSDYAMNDEVRLMPTPGHTIDHYSVLVGNGDDGALIAGDMVHSPLQMRYPELGMFSDHDSGIAGRTRRRMFAELCDMPTLLCTAHFPGPSAGRVVSRGDAYDFRPL